MRFVKISELLQFIRDNDCYNYYSVFGNSYIRNYLWQCVHKKNFWYSFNNGQELNGFIEWYRLPDYKYFSEVFIKQKNPMGVNNGRLLWVQNIVFKKGKFSLPIFRKFLNFFDGISHVYGWKYKNKKFFVYELRRIDNG
jgi:hypothetical protein